MTGDYPSYLDSVASRLRSDRLELTPRVQVGSRVCDFVGIRNQTFPSTRTYFCSIAFVSNPDTTSVREHLAQVFEYAKAFQKSSIFYIFPVIASQIFPQDAKDVVLSEEGIDYTNRYEFTTKHPVLAELETGLVYHFDRTNHLWYSVLYDAVKFTTKHFSFPSEHT